MAKDIGFHVSATFIYSLPGETHEDRMKCTRLSRELNLDMVKFSELFFNILTKKVTTFSVATFIRKFVGYQGVVISEPKNSLLT